MKEIIIIILSFTFSVGVSWVIFCVIISRLIDWVFDVIFKFFDKFKLK